MNPELLIPPLAARHFVTCVQMISNENSSGLSMTIKLWIIICRIVHSRDESQWRTGNNFNVLTSLPSQGCSIPGDLHEFLRVTSAIAPTKNAVFDVHEQSKQSVETFPSYIQLVAVDMCLVVYWRAQLYREWLWTSWYKCCEDSRIRDWISITEDRRLLVNWTRTSVSLTVLWVLDCNHVKERSVYT